MAGIESINGQSLYFAAAQAAARQKTKESEEKKKSSSVKKSVFSSSLEKTQEEHSLASDGLPIELAGMSMEDAVVFLKDEVDIAGDNLAASPDLEQIENYRKKLGNFLKYVSRNNYEVLTYTRKYKGRPLLDRKTGKPAYYVQIQVINEKLAQLTEDLVYNHRKNINILARVEEINGLIVDLMAS